MQTIALLNQKGGVGKTSTCHHLSWALSRRGRRVLLIDADPQASLTQGFWGPEQAFGLPVRRSLVALYDDVGLTDPASLVASTGFEGIDLIPGHARMQSYNLPDSLRDGRRTAIRDALADLGDRYDVALIDCPPNICLCAWSALVAASGVIVPLQAEDYGAQGIGAIQDAIRLVGGGPNPGLRLLGYLITMFQKSTNVHSAYEELLRNLYGSDVFATNVPLAKDFKEAIMARLPVGAYKPRSAAAKSIAALAEEVEARAGGNAMGRVA